MRWTGDVSAGDWIAARLGRPGTVGGTVPIGFEAYARIFHPVEGTRLTASAASPERFDSRPFSWAELASEKGTVWHGGMQWDAVVGKQFDGVDLADGWTVRSPILGHLDLDQLAVLAGLLATNTMTAARCVVGVWNGWGDLRPGSGSVSVLAFAGEVDPAQRREAEESFRRMRREAVSPEVSIALQWGPLLELPQREYVLLAADVRELTDPSWTEAAGVGWAGQFSGPTLNLLWPADHAWFLASEIDFDSTLVGGSRTLIDAIVADPVLEAAEVGPETDLTWRGDALNPMPPG